MPALSLLGLRGKILLALAGLYHSIILSSSLAHIVRSRNPYVCSCYFHEHVDIARANLVVQYRMRRISNPTIRASIVRVLLVGISPHATSHRSRPSPHDDEAGARRGRGLHVARPVLKTYQLLF